MNRFTCGMLVIALSVAGASIGHAQTCRTSSDGSECVPLSCSDVPEEQCLPEVITLDIRTGALTVDGCHCQDFNLCHIRFGDASPYAAGYCPNGAPCRVVSEDTNNDGIADWFAASCDVPKCCDPETEPGSGSNPLCFEGHTCCHDGVWRCNNADGTPTCEAGAVCGVCCAALCPVIPPGCIICFDGAHPDTCGHFKGEGTTCDEPEACCLGSPGDNAGPCEEIDPFCCRSVGGTPQGPGSTCFGSTGFSVCDTGACCFKTPVVGPPPLGLACEQTNGSACEELGGSFFSGMDCGATEACCLDVDASGEAPCVDLNPLCCKTAGGRPGGPNTHCGDPTDPNAISCAQGCHADSDCPAVSQFCRFPIGSCGSTAAKPGECTERPQFCPDVWAPVCGCDGVTYGNSCEADAAGMSIRHPGPCEPVGACCFDFDDGPVPFDTCLMLDREICAAEGGVFGDANVSCENTEACCLTFAGEDICADLNPFCCMLSGGVPQGSGTSCHGIDIPATCGGFTGIPCPDGYLCVDDPNDNCPGGPAVDCPGICVPDQLECGGFQGLECPPSFHCVDNPNDNCDPVTGADCVGVCIPAPPPCVEICGGIAGIRCSNPDEFCKLPVGGCCCDFFGVCTLPPEGCPDVYDPVCGCDGVTYGNECEADAAGMSIDHDGPCEAFCATDSDCPANDQFCKFDPGTCGQANAPGRCVTRPTECPAIYDPVCGCNGVTYGNECESDAAGVSIRHFGTCQSRCEANSDCNASNQFCKFPEGTCGAPGSVGTCTSLPGGCPDVWDPVCGCNGVTFGNECEADAAGMSIRHHGACEVVCLSDSDCPNPDQFCKHPVGHCDPDDPGLPVPGVCTPVPVACPEFYQPVCGCDGVTYANECFADMARVTVAYEGECEPAPCVATRVFDPNLVPAWYCPGTPRPVHIIIAPPDGTTSLALEDSPPAGWTVIDISDDGHFDEVNRKVKWGPFFAPFPRQVGYVVVPGPTSGIAACFEGAVSLDGINEAICGQRCLSVHCPQFMAADTPQPACSSCPADSCTECDDGCRNGVIGMCELVAYACSWKNGCHDDLSGVGRAAYIWRNGECYCWDEAGANWFATDCPPPTDGLCDSATNGGGAAGSSLGPVIAQATGHRSNRPGKRARGEVALQLSPPPGASAVALEIQVPEGWLATAVSDEGRWDTVNGKIKWGPFTSNLSRVVSVTLEPSTKQPRDGRAGAPRAALSTRIRGTISVDGMNEPFAIHVR